MSCLEKGQATLLSSPDKKRIQPAIDSLMRTDDMILSVSLTTMAGDTLYWNDGYSNAIHINSLDPDFLQKIYAHNGSGVLSNPITHTSKRKYPASNTSIYYGRLLRSLTHNFRPIGILLVEVDIASFEDILIFSNIFPDNPKQYINMGLSGGESELSYWRHYFHRRAWYAPIFLLCCNYKR